MFGQIEPYQQSTGYSCSAATLHAVLKHWGDDVSEGALAYLLPVSPVTGASAARVVKLAKRFGYRAKSRTFENLNELKHVTDDGVPVIARVKSWRHPGDYHFVIVTSIDDFGVSVMDPNVEGNCRRLDHAEMWERWAPGCVGIVIVPEHSGLGAWTGPQIAFWAGLTAAVGLAAVFVWAIVGRAGR